MRGQLLRQLQQPIERVNVVVRRTQRVKVQMKERVHRVRCRVKREEQPTDLERCARAPAPSAADHVAEQCDEKWLVGRLGVLQPDAAVKQRTHRVQRLFAAPKSSLGELRRELELPRLAAVLPEPQQTVDLARMTLHDVAQELRVANVHSLLEFALRLAIGRGHCEREASRSSIRRLHHLPVNLHPEATPKGRPGVAGPNQPPATAATRPQRELAFRCGSGCLTAMSRCLALLSCLADGVAPEDLGQLVRHVDVQ
mmetsp:Transcript_55230/g.127004  ORF Transcript_55230/g.127004 Transcript_55230/m.127004 type:complete len:255 (-) Transcript_55230:326-1090(-)